MAGVFLVENPPNTNHISSIDPKGFDAVADSLGCRRRMTPGYYSLTHFTNNLQYDVDARG